MSGEKLRQPSVELHIEELVLHGFAAGDHDRIGAAVERELSLLLSADRASFLPAQSTEIGRVDSGSFVVRPDTTTDVLGARIARSIHASLTSSCDVRASLANTGGENGSTRRR